MKRLKMQLSNTFCLGGVQFQADYSDAGLAARTSELLEDLFQLTPPASLPDGQEPEACVRLALATSGTLPVPPEAELIESTDGLRIYRDQLCFFLEYGESALRVTPHDNHCQDVQCEGILAVDFWSRPTVEQRRFLLQLVVLAAYRRHRFVLHANAVAVSLADGSSSGCLFVGQSGAGKSTLSLNCVRSGWDYVSDDVVFLAALADGVYALGANRHWSCTQKTLDGLPESLRGGLTQRNDEEKRLLPTTAIENARLRSQCQPRLIVFPQIVAEEQSRIAEISRAEAMARLIEYSGSILVDRDIAAEQLRLLARLAEQATCLRLWHGQDAQADTQTVAQLLARYVAVPAVTDCESSRSTNMPTTM